MEQRISLITLGVADMARASAFYDALGWRRVESPPSIAAYDLIGQTLALYPIADLARDIGLDPSELSMGGATYAHNVRDKEDVAQLLAQAETAGARLLKPASDIFWGGHNGYFADPDGHIWEIAWNPYAPLSKAGAFRWGGY